MGLNPCFNGRYSQRYYEYYKSVEQLVLMLVLMEDTLRAIGLVVDPVYMNES